MFELHSSAFDDGGAISERHARRGDNISPFLEWSDPPEITQSYVLVMEDIDADEEAVRHWAVFDISAERRHLAEGRSSKARTEDLPHAYNDFGSLRYDGPDLPWREPAHRYRFRLAALAVPSLGVGPDPDALTVWEAARDSVLAEATLTGTFEGPR